jgi:hypothetical protein
VYRREVETEGEPSLPPPELYLTGLWGSGNTAADTRLRFADQTVYTLWDGHALLGPGRPGTSLEKYPVLVGTIAMSVFIERYGALGGYACRVLTGDAIVGLACPSTCAHVAEVCDEPSIVCDDDCATWPRALSECVASASTCDEIDSCGVVEWNAKFQ